MNRIAKALTEYFLQFGFLRVLRFYPTDQKHAVGLIADSDLSTGVNVSVNGYLYPYVRTVIYVWPIQGETLPVAQC